MRCFNRRDGPDLQHILRCQPAPGDGTSPLMFEASDTSYTGHPAIRFNPRQTVARDSLCSVGPPSPIAQCPLQTGRDAVQYSMPAIQNAKRRTARRMPTYVYGCDACGHQFERFQKFSDDPIRTCPECSSAVRRIFQPAGIVFKGSGWHITDYKRSGRDGASESSGSNGASDTKSDDKAGSNGESKATESKPATDSKPAASTV